MLGVNVALRLACPQALSLDNGEMASEVQTNLRLPADLKDRLVTAADENNRSLSAEVALRLDNSFKSGGDLSVLDWMRLAGALSRFAVYIDEHRQKDDRDTLTTQMATAIANADFEEILDALTANLGIDTPDEPVTDFAMTLHRASMVSRVARGPRIQGASSETSSVPDEVRVKRVDRKSASKARPTTRTTKK